MRNKNILVGIVCCCIVLFLLVASAVDWQLVFGTQNVVEEITQSTVIIESKFFQEQIPLVHQGVLEYIQKNNQKTPQEISQQYAEQKEQLAQGLPVEYAYNVVGLPSGVSVEKAIMEVSESKDGTASTQYEVDIVSQTVRLFHLKTGVRYYFGLTLTLSNGKTAGTVGEFSTASSPRILSIDGVANLRDLGGWETSNGKTVGQGLVYRGSELEGNTYQLTETGKTQMTQTLGIACEIDLRSSADTKTATSLIGEKVKREGYPLAERVQIMAEDQKNAIRKVFASLAKKENYPIYMHCTDGGNQTGVVCYLLQGILGVSVENAEKEYYLSSFAGASADTENFNSVKTALDGCSGNTFAEKAESYLLSIGVTKPEIESIQTILLK